MKKRYFEEVELLAQKYNTDLFSGLTKREARMRLEKEKKADKGRRSLFVPKSNGFVSSIVSFYKSPYSILLMALALVAVIFGYYKVGGPVLIITSFGSVLIGISYLKVKINNDKMLLYSVPMTKVIRSNKIFRTDSRNIVVGDIICFEHGDCIPCDARLIASNNLTVGEYIKENGEIKRIITSKDESKVEENDFYSSDTVYAGSQVITGEGKAIVIRTGSKVKTLEVIGNGILGKKNSDCNGTLNVVRGFERLNIFIIIGVLVVTIIGMFVVKDRSMIDILLAAISSVLVITSGFIPMACRIICSDSILRVKRFEKKSENAVIKNTRSLDPLCEMTDLFLFGRAGITDGKKHVDKILFNGEQINRDDVRNKRVNVLPDFIYCYLKCLEDCNNQYFGTLFEDGYAVALKSYIDLSGCDTSKIDLIMKSMYFLSGEKEKDCFACLEFEDENLKICMTFDTTVIDECQKIRESSNAVELTSQKCDMLHKFVETAINEGQTPIIIVTDDNEGKIFEGIMCFSESNIKDLDEILKQYNNAGINVKLFFEEENSENLNYALKSGIANSDNSIARASEFLKHGYDITQDYGKYCVYMGFSIKEYEKLVRFVKLQGGSVTSYSVCNKYNPVLNSSDLMVTCDYIMYDSKSYSEAAYEGLEAEGCESAKIASHSTRVNAGVIVKRSGGLKGILNARYAAREAYLNLSFAMLYIVSSSAVRIVFTVLSLLTGAVMLQSIRNMSLWVVLDITGIMFFASNKANRTILEGKRKITSLFPQLVFEKNFKRIIALMCGIPVYFVAVITLKLSGFIPDYFSAGVATYIALVLCGIFEFLIISGKYSDTRFSIRFIRTLMSAIMPILLSIVCLISPVIFNTVGSLAMNIHAVVLVPIYLVIYFLGIIIVENIRPSKKQKRKVKI